VAVELSLNKVDDANLAAARGRRERAGKQFELVLRMELSLGRALCGGGSSVNSDGGRGDGGDVPKLLEQGVLLEDALGCEDGGDRVMCELLATWLKGQNEAANISALVVSAKGETDAHYQAVVKRLGVPLKTLRAGKAELITLNCLDDDVADAASLQRTGALEDSDGRSRAADIVRKVFRVLDSMTTSEGGVEMPRNVLVVIDDLSALGVLLGSTAQVLDVIHYVRRKLLGMNAAAVGMLAVVHADVESPLILSRIERAFATVVALRGLTTGRAPEIDGELSILKCAYSALRGSRSAEHAQQKSSDRVLYCATDNGMRYFYSE